MARLRTPRAGPAAPKAPDCPPSGPCPPACCPPDVIAAGDGLADCVETGCGGRRGGCADGVSRSGFAEGAGSGDGAGSSSGDAGGAGRGRLSSRGTSGGVAATFTGGGAGCPPRAGESSCVAMSNVSPAQESRPRSSSPPWTETSPTDTTLAPATTSTPWSTTETRKQRVVIDSRFMPANASSDARRTHGSGHGGHRLASAEVMVGWGDNEPGREFQGNDGNLGLRFGDRRILWCLARGPFQSYDPLNPLIAENESWLAV